MVKKDIDYLMDKQEQMFIRLMDQAFKYMESKDPANVINDEVLLRRLEHLEQRINATSDRVALTKAFGVKK